MKIIVTGSLGHISLPLIKELVQKGHEVVVISSNADRQEAIEALGATAAIGSLEDVDFLTATFTGADAVYCMVPPNNYFDHSLDLHAYYRRLGQNYAVAIAKSGVKRVVNLSTIGAHLEKGSGILIGAHDLAEISDGLPADVAITHMRPTSFYYNLYSYLPMIKNQGVIATNYGYGDIVPLGFAN
ncbi:NAD(P)H-binding protein [Mucilaginibacter humi]|uniref:NAD(P)H-binding protein n=1 Tax=Mucilaginibacter humi TaxID=2732510 RepID=UPI001FE80A3C|nr:NAD(P)H-binding protein [Mucilaginibacter humi]